MIGLSRSLSRNLVKIRLVGPFQSNGCLPSSSHSRTALSAEPPFGWPITAAGFDFPILPRYPSVEWRRRIALAESVFNTARLTTPLAPHTSQTLQLFPISLGRNHPACTCGEGQGVERS